MKSTDPSVSVVIPTLDEESGIEACLAQFDLGAPVEVIVVDGGSRDRTRDLAESRCGVRVIEAERGRGTQMNEAARHARADTLLFLHADTFLPAGWLAAVSAAMADPRISGGWFRLRTHCPQRSRLTNLALRMCDIRPNLFGQPWGDCAFFVRRRTFEEMGGYQDIPLMEDCDFAERMSARGRVARLPLTVTTSGRRFAARPIRTTAMTLTFPILFKLGVSARTLGRLYGLAR